MSYFYLTTYRYSCIRLCYVDNAKTYNIVVKQHLEDIEVYFEEEGIKLPKTAEQFEIIGKVFYIDNIPQFINQSLELHYKDDISIELLINKIRSLNLKEYLYTDIHISELQKFLVEQSV